ncbi:glycosyltransferase family 39 protein [Baaleninema sp.]|uniref:glycosyltransferase family 39 protein n=1 Tax=Baaleninema sp. TaxID=3101197 RepID=UPI003D083180
MLFINKSQITSPKTLSWIIIIYAIAVRFVQYIANRSLWADESVLALNIVDRNYLELLEPLDYNQGAPIGFLWVEKLAIQLLGNNEYALRLFPFICGIASIFLFYDLAKRSLNHYGVPMALAFFATLEYLVYYTTELKQYSSDVAVALILAWLTQDLLKRDLNFKNTAIYSIIGAVIIWFSHPAVLVAGGFALFSLIKLWRNRDFQRLPKLITVFAVWGISFLGFYFLSIQSLSNNETLMESWRSAFPSELTDINWLAEKWWKLFENPLGFSENYYIIAANVFFFIGVFSLFRRNPSILAFLTSPLLATILAAYLRQYPFRNRLLLFLTPFIILLIAEGLHYLRNTDSRKFIEFKHIGTVFFILLIIQPLFQTTALFVNPITREEIRPVIAYVKEHQQPGDVLYIFQRGEYQFQYYAEKFGYEEGDYIVGVDDLEDGKEVSPPEWERYTQDLNALQGNPRVWLIFSHIDDVEEERDRVLGYIDSLGQKRDRYDAPGAFALLYDFTANDETP